MIFTFYKAMGKAVGASLVEDDKVDLAKELMKKAEAKAGHLSPLSDTIRGLSLALCCSAPSPQPR